MAVRTHESDLMVFSKIVEVRFDDGDRFLDRRGELIVQLRKIHSDLIVAEPQTSVIATRVGPTSFNITPKKFDLSQVAEQKVSDAKSNVELLAKQAAQSQPVIVETLGVSATTRVGARFGFLAKSDNLEESDKFICRAVKCATFDELAGFSGDQLVDTQLVLVTDDSETGVRRKVTYASLITKPGRKPFDGIGVAEGSGGIGVDVDTFMRPETGHLEKLEVFVNTAYVHALQLAQRALKWMQHQQANRR